MPRKMNLFSYKFAWWVCTVIGGSQALQSTEGHLYLNPIPRHKNSLFWIFHGRTPRHLHNRLETTKIGGTGPLDKETLQLQHHARSYEVRKTKGLDSQQSLPHGNLIDPKAKHLLKADYGLQLPWNDGTSFFSLKSPPEALDAVAEELGEIQPEGVFGRHKRRIRIWGGKISRIFGFFGRAAMRFAESIKRLYLNVIQPALERTTSSHFSSKQIVKSLEQGTNLVAEAVGRTIGNLRRRDLVNKNLTEALDLQLRTSMPKDKPLFFRSLRNQELIVLRRGEVVGKGGFATVASFTTAEGSLFAGKVFHVTEHNNDLKSFVKSQLRSLNCLPEGTDVWRAANRLGLALPLDVVEKVNAGNILRATVGPSVLNAFVLAPLFPVDLMSLVSVLRANEPSDQAVLLSLTQQIVTSVRNLHSLGLLHLDIKPQNFLVSNQGRVFLADLDDLKRIGSSVFPVTYSPAYVSPELARSLIAKDRDALSTTQMDSWQLGVSIYVLWCKRFPKMGYNKHTDYFAILMAIRRLVEGAIEYDQQCASLIPGEVLDLIAQLVTVDPAMRLTATAAAASHPVMFLSAPEIGNVDLWRDTW